MRKKKIALLFWFIVLATAIGVGAKLLDGSEKKIYSKKTIDEYGLTISYPLSYEDIEEEGFSIEEITANITASVSETNKENGISLNLVKEVIHAKSDDSKLTLLVEAIKKEKSKKSLEEICKNYITMFKVFNEDLVVMESDYEIVEVGGYEAGKTTIYVYGKKENVYPGMISYLVPLEDREITIVFSGTKDLITTAEKEINKIINSVEFSDLKDEDLNDNSGELSGDKINANEIIDKVNSETTSGD